MSSIRESAPSCIAGEAPGRKLLQSVRERRAGQRVRVTTIEVNEVVQARQKAGLSQAQFAQALGVSKRTLQEWEQGRRAPAGAAQALIGIAQRYPEVVREMLPDRPTRCASPSPLVSSCDSGRGPAAQENAMNASRPVRGALPAAALAAALVVLPAGAADVVEVGSAVPDAQSVKEGLFPEETCKELEAAGFRCMGFKPAVRYSLPATSFAVGSAELPPGLKRQLEVFAEVLRGKRGSGRVVRIEGHADATGSPDINFTLSQRRADAVKDYLVSLGADPAMLTTIGLGASAPKVADNPRSAENRRVEIGREK